MPPSLSLGPLVIATDRLLALLLITGFLLFAGWISRRTHASAEQTGLLAVALGLLAARAGYVICNWDAFRQDYWSTLAVWQGGFSVLAGVATAVVAVTLLSWNSWRSGVLLGAAVAALSAVYLTAASSMTLPAKPLPPTITLMSLDGRALPTGALRGQPAVINLWATWCPPCRREMPMLIEEAARSPVPVLLVNQGEGEASVRAFLRAERLPGTAIRLNPTSTVGAAAGSSALPTTLFIDSAGQIRSIHAGEISRAALLSGIRDLASAERRLGAAR